MRPFVQRVLLTTAIAAALAALGTPPATAAPLDYGGGCTIVPGNRAATVDSLRFRCSPAQQDAIFHAASRGAVPMGATSGWVTRPPDMVAMGAAFWQGKVFYTGPGGGTLLNRSVFGNVWRADVYPAPAIFDGGPAWGINYAPAGTPQLYDEIREVSPGVWFGYSWRREGPPSQILAFVLAYR